MTDPNGAAIHGVPWIPSTKNPGPMLVYIYIPAPAGSYVLIEVRHGRFMEYMRIIRMTIPCESQPRFPKFPQDGWQASFPAMMGLVA